MRIASALTFSALLGLSLAGPATAGINRWTPLGPGGGGRVSALAVAPSSPNDPGAPETLYAAAFDAGLYKSTDGGTSWRWSADGMAGRSIAKIVLDPSRPSVLFAVAIGPDLFRSTDAGAHWTRVYSGYSLNAVALVPGKPSAVYLADGVKVLRSTDDGGHWSEIFSGEPGAVGHIAVAPTQPRTIFLSTQVALQRSTDGGASWTVIPGFSRNPQIADLVIAPSDPRRVYVAAGNGFYRSVDGGDSWTGPFAFHAITLAVVPQTPSTIYAGTAQLDVWRSTDGGTTWRRFSHGLPATLLPVETLAISPSQPATIYAGVDFAGVAKTTDGGAHWKLGLQTGLSIAPASFFAVDPHHPSTFYITLDGPGVLRSVDRGRTWEKAPLPPATFETAVAFDPRDPTALYALPFLYRSHDDGATWSRLGLPNGEIAAALAFPARRVILAGGCGISRSADDGKTFVPTLPCDAGPAGDLTRNVARLASDPHHPLTVYAGMYVYGERPVDNTPELWRSDDGGLHWQRTAGGPLFALDPVLPRTLYYAAGNAVLRSTDRGDTWQPAGTVEGNAQGDTIIRDLIADPSAAATLYAATDVGVQRSTDGGTTWTLLNAGLARMGRTSVTHLVAHPTDPHHFYALAAVGGVFEATFPE
jgi:photosystem II stability/assembly factor-like uncharacterized protein